MTNQIPEEDRKKIEDLAEDASCGSGVAKYYVVCGYTLGLQSAEKRVKELEDGLKEMLRWTDGNCAEEPLCKSLTEAENKAKKILGL